MSSKEKIAEDELLDEVEGDEGDEAEESSGKGLTAKKGYATPGRRARAAAEAEEESGIIQRPVGAIREYFEGVISEFHKVAWPTRQDAIRLTSIVLVVMLLSALVLGVVSFSINQIFEIGLTSPIVFAVLFVIAVGAFMLYLRNSNRGGASY